MVQLHLFMADLENCEYSCFLLLNVMFRPSPLTSMSLSASFILKYVTISSQAYSFTITTTSSAGSRYILLCPQSH